MKVLIVPEDPTLDQYILKPIVERIFADLNKPARVSVLKDPHMRGVDQALDPQQLASIVGMYPMIDLFLVLVDRDAEAGRADVARARESEHPGKLLVCCAIEEVEVWLLALHRGSLDGEWRTVRSHEHPKERYAEPFLRERAPAGSLGRGRVWAMRDLGREFRGLLTVCEELADLRERIAATVRTALV